MAGSPSCLLGRSRPPSAHFKTQPLEGALAAHPCANRKELPKKMIENGIKRFKKKSFCDPQFFSVATTRFSAPRRPLLWGSWSPGPAARCWQELLGRAPWPARSPQEAPCLHFFLPAKRSGCRRRRQNECGSQVAPPVPGQSGCRGQAGPGRAPSAVMAVTVPASHTHARSAGTSTTGSGTAGWSCGASGFLLQACRVGLPGLLRGGGLPTWPGAPASAPRPLSTRGRSWTAGSPPETAPARGSRSPWSPGNSPACLSGSMRG